MGGRGSAQVRRQGEAWLGCECLPDNSVAGRQPQQAALLLLWRAHLANDLQVGQAVAGICLLLRGLEAKVHGAGLCRLGAQLRHRQHLALHIMGERTSSNKAEA